jgi:serine/threonine-protein kinase
MKHLREPVPRVRDRRRDVPASVDAIVARALAKRPEERFPSTEDLVAALEAARDDIAGDSEGATGVLRRAHGRRGPSGRRRRTVSPLLAALAVIAAGALALVFLLTRNDGSPGAAAVGRVKLAAIADYDPQGDGTEHPEAVPRATDGDPSTFWTTETYDSFAKPGVGLILDAGKEVEIEHLQIVSDEPGFTAQILAGNNASAGFVPYSEEQQIGSRTTLELAGGKSYRYYVIWITDPNRRAHVNEVRAG